MGACRPSCVISVDCFPVDLVSPAPCLDDLLDCVDFDLSSLCSPYLNVIDPFESESKLLEEVFERVGVFVVQHPHVVVRDDVDVWD